jgi:peptide/nickel transport system permease protein
MRITRFLLGRLGALLGLLLMLSLLLFVLQEISGADPVDATMQRASEEAKAAKRAELGLDDPAIARYVRYVGDLVQLDFGTSFRTKHAVVTDIASYLPQTVELVVVAILLTLALALLFSVSSVLRWPGSSVFRTVLFVGSTAPTFVLGIFGLLLFYQELHWLPGAGSLSDPDSVPDGTGFMFTHAVTHLDPGLAWDVLSHMLMPATALAIGPALAIGRVLRSSIETTLDSDFVRTARAKGLTEWGGVAQACAAELRQRRPVDDRPLHGLDVRRRPCHRVGLQPDRARLLPWPEPGCVGLPGGRGGDVRARRDLHRDQHRRRHPAGRRRSADRGVMRSGEVLM